MLSSLLPSHIWSSALANSGKVDCNLMYAASVSHKATQLTESAGFSLSDLLGMRDGSNCGIGQSLWVWPCFSYVCWIVDSVKHEPIIWIIIMGHMFYHLLIFTHFYFYIIISHLSKKWTNGCLVCEMQLDNSYNTLMYHEVMDTAHTYVSDLLHPVPASHTVSYHYMPDSITSFWKSWTSTLNDKM